ncbi:hypothetical protein MAR_026231, partial [Mya arenaria]
VDGLQKVNEIFTSLTVDPGVKKICRGPTCHYTARLAHATSLYLTLVRGKQFYFIHYNDFSLRHRLAHDTSLYLTLVRVTQLFSNDERTCYEVSHILALLLFDEQARHGMRDAVYNAVGTLVNGAIITVRSMKEHPGQNLQHLPQTIDHLTEQSFRLSRQKPSKYTTSSLTPEKQFPHIPMSETFCAFNPTTVPADDQAELNDHCTDEDAGGPIYLRSSRCQCSRLLVPSAEKHHYAGHDTTPGNHNSPDAEGGRTLRGAMPNLGL